MDIQFTNENALHAPITLEPVGFMSDSISMIRHRNARKILETKCSGTIKEFAKAVGKSEQQCSNFLRMRNPVKIGDSVAREIEFAFGFPNKWMDLEDHKDQEIAEYVNADILSHFREVDDAVRHLSTLVIDGVSFADSVLIAEFGAYSIERFQKLLRHVRHDLLDECKKMLLLVARKLQLEVVTDEPYSVYDVITKDAVFKIITNKDEGNYHSYPLTSLATPKDKLAFEVFPIILHGKPELVIIEDRSMKVDNLTETDEYRVFEVVTMIKEFDDRCNTDILTPYLNTHPLLHTIKQNKQIN